MIELLFKKNKHSKEVIFILRFDCKRAILFIVIATLASIFFIVSASASVTLLSSDTNELTDGIYNIINSSTGEYLDVYDTKYDENGRLYLTKRSQKSGQDFLIKRQDDGTYIITPQSEKGLYTLSYESDIMEGEFISKEISVSNQSKFSIIKTENESDLYQIKPACMTDNQLSLTVTSTQGKYNYTLAGLSVENESAEQKWQFVKVSSEILDISSGYINVGVGKTSTLYAKLTPSHLTGNLKWESEDPSIATVDKNGSVYGVAQGQTVVTVYCGDKSASAIVKVTDKTAYTWYSQHNITSGGWYANSLSDVYFTAGASKPFFVSGYRSNNDWMDAGCKLSCEAMVLHNLGATMENGYDIRTGKAGTLEADPFTVALANIGATEKNSQTKRFSGNPVVINNNMVTARFTVDGKAIAKTEYTGNSLKHIKELLEQHPEGVIVGMFNSARNSHHYFVFTECLNPDDPNGNYEFRVCDSAATDPKYGDNVPFRECTSYKTYRYSSIFSYSVYNIAE